MSELCGHFKLPQLISGKWKTFGVLLLNDETGSHVDDIEGACPGRPEDMVKKILDDWIHGRGRDVTWKILIETLRDCELRRLADQIYEAKIKGTVYSEFYLCC